MITVSNLYKNYGKLEVLKNIQLNIAKGEVVSIAGASGAGKTTLLQIMGTIGNPDKGKVFINNIDVFSLRGKTLANFRNKHIGFVFQFHNLLAEFTAVENICIPAFIANERQSKAEKRAKEILSFLNLEERANHKPSQLSGGEQQRVAIARALINNPDVILADEPSGNLDSKNRDEIHKLFFKLRDTFGQTIVIVTHDKNLAETADRKIIMSDGKIIDNKT
ncbi:MAG: ABC transporter ATP-binding protein [Prevotellaceae bacterium]|jgi:lipoprotein-releasing system ATP-binding protein|nr:ABC transporter ATP-binding protein [Prevotellaceae bacterium]